jgi:hypothetical protein
VESGGRKHCVHSTSEIAAIVKLDVRNQLQSVRQGSFDSIISYTLRYYNDLKLNMIMVIQLRMGQIRQWIFPCTQQREIC